MDQWPPKQYQYPYQQYPPQQQQQPVMGMQMMPQQIYNPAQTQQPQQTLYNPQPPQQQQQQFFQPQQQQPQTPVYTPQPAQFMQFVQQTMQQKGIPPHYLQDPNFRTNFIKNIMPMMQQQPIYPTVPQPQPYYTPQPQARQPIRPLHPNPQAAYTLKKKNRGYDYEEDEEIIEEEPSSEEAEFTDTTESEEEEFNQDMYDEDVSYDQLTTVRRTAGRERKNEKKFSSETSDVDEE